MRASQTVALTRRGAALWMVCGLTVPACAAEPAPVVPDKGAEPAQAVAAAMSLPVFDIPSQPLAAALNQYGALADQPAVFVSSMVAGRTSTAVYGRYTPEVALRLLLQGTGLSFEKLTSRFGTTFMLKQDGPPTPRVSLSTFYSLRNYPGMIQARIQEALCATPMVMPGSIDAVFRFQIDGEGRLHDAVLIDSTGSVHRDAALLDAVRQVRMGVPPPAAVLEQPLTMRLQKHRYHAVECTPRTMPSPPPSAPSPSSPPQLPQATP